MDKRYIIWAPALTRSAGTKALYALYGKLRAKGCTALLFCPEEHREEYEYIDVLDEHTLRNDIVVYPEIVWGNPLRFSNVVRFVFYFPGRLAGEPQFHHSELVFTWWVGYFEAPVLHWPTLDTSLFYNENLPRTHNCYFLNKKYDNMKLIDALDGAIEITMSYPASRAELAQLLKTTKTLYTFDRYSLLNDEAYACGAEVCLVQDGELAPYQSDPYIDVAEAETQLVSFIAATQAMNYGGELQDDTPFLDKFGGLNYKTAMRCAACGAWEQALTFAHKAFCGRPLRRPALGDADSETPASPAGHDDAAGPKWHMLLERYSAFVQRTQLDQADAVLYEGMMSAIADNRREVFALLAALRSVLRENRGQGGASLRYAELALLADPLNAMASQMCVYQYLAAGKVNLAVMTACRMFCLFLKPLVFERAFFGTALLGLVVAQSGQSPVQLAAKMPQIMQGAVDVVKKQVASPSVPREWGAKLAEAEQSR